MMQQLKYLMLLSSIICSSYTFSQFTIIVENANDFHDSISNKMFIAGNFNGWNPADSSTMLVWEDGVLQTKIVIDSTLNTLEYKFTCGSWEKGEVKKNGAPQPNRTCFYKPGMVVKENIESFAHIAPKWQPEENTSVIKIKLYAKTLNKEKTIRILLPCNYEKNNLKYPVLYMLDGQNLFDETMSHSGEWGVDEAMDSLCMINKMPAIIIGIDHAGEERIAEYSPYPIQEYVTQPQGDAFVEFVVNTLKPFIDSAYRTKPEREFTGIAGSSMGGVMSMYMVMKYNNVFSKAGVFSPAFWTNESNYENVKATIVQQPTQIYFLAGALEGKEFEVVNDTKKMLDILLQQNNPNINTRFVTQSTGRHTESFWNAEFFEMFEWLFLK
jgi:predicted alpha/beta superfamily hydrolase